MPPKKRQKQDDYCWESIVASDSPKSPLVQLSPDASDTVLDIGSDSLFEDMISPMPPNVFLDYCFRKRALHISDSYQARRIQPIVQAMGDLDPFYILQETSSDNVFVWISNSKHKKISSVEIDNVDTAVALHRAGHATYCRAPPDVEQPMVAQLLRGTGMGCGNYDPSGNSTVCMGRGEVEVFMGTCQHTTDWHFDFQENFTLQLSGVKRWTLQQGTVRHPLRGCTPHYQAPKVVESQLKAAHLSDANFQFQSPPTVGVNAVGDETAQVLVKAGDMLYFPAGMWHKVETVEPGVSINVSLMATNYAALVTQALHHVLLTRDEWRQSIVSGNVTDALEHLQQLLHTLPTEIERLNRIHFAEQILPPIMRDPSKLQLMENQDENQEQEHDDTAEHDDNEMQVVNDKEDDEIVDIHDSETFGHGLASYNLPGKLVVNSLASLIATRDITSFYSDNDDKENGHTPLYVLNINYAGNEMHESTVRVVLQDRHATLAKFVDGMPRDEIACPAGVQEAWQECLLYYGFFVWIPNGSL
jgi:hypothetical protein